ncbi:uncharacterized protein TM35_000061330 [Trypanosoma theileri]|uniref:Uncharacterized protein n=1 Tax=Trypanosoma theileri TaxID=67003 RepID=A0A1X0P2S7_9TRYP|nr:uncharacterized protein TM35_000061330 [Trypanosoma theileri]ORC91128.1 hypothetical protein TM35_000061330 [Trypanosoma theileri]
MGLLNQTPRVVLYALVLLCVVFLFTANWVYFSGVGNPFSTVVEPADDGQTHSLGVSSVFAFDAAQDTLRLTEAEQQRVERRAMGWNPLSFACCRMMCVSPTRWVGSMCVCPSVVALVSLQ